MKASRWLLALLISGFHMAALSDAGRYLGADPVETPAWFKNSFLDLAEDIEEAAENNKRLLLYFHQEGCPYCSRMIKENFTETHNLAYVQKHFDVVEINMWGDRDLVAVGERDFKEKEFAAALRVQYTPTLIFLDEQGKVALRLNGYYPPQKLQQALRFVAGHEEKNQSFAEYQQAQSQSQRSALINEDFYRPVGSPRQHDHLAVYFESNACEACETLHAKVLSDPATRALIPQMDNWQIDRFSTATIKTPDGRRLPAREWADELNIGYTPSVVFFDKDQRVVMRIEGFIKTFHFQSVYDYVLTGSYIKEPSFQRYIAARGEHLRELGFDTDIWGYESFHPADGSRFLLPD